MKQYSEYRALARETLKGRWNEMALLTLVISAIGVVFGIPSAIGDIMKLQWLSLCGSSCNIFFALLFTVPLSFAFYNLCLVYTRRESLDGSYLSAMFKDFAAHWSKYVLSGTLMVVLVMLISIPTLIIGGIILAYAYNLIPYIIHDHPDMGVREVLKTSRLMMRGHKWQMFVLQMTFIGWAILAILSCGIGLLWLVPYEYTAMAHFYEDVKAEYEAQQ